MVEHAIMLRQVDGFREKIWSVGYPPPKHVVCPGGRLPVMFCIQLMLYPGGKVPHLVLNRNAAKPHGDLMSILKPVQCFGVSLLGKSV